MIMGGDKLYYGIQPLTREYMFPSHLSEEPEYKLAVDELKLEPFLDLNMRLGDGSGCPIAMNIIELALAISNNMMSFEDMNSMKQDGLLY